MTKNLILLILSLLFFINVKAQQNKASDTTIYFRNEQGYPTDKQHVFDVIFIYPADSSSGKKLYPVKEFYLDGTVKLTGFSNKLASKPILEGATTTYYTNGNKKSVINYIDGRVVGNITLYYPNGNLYSIMKFNGKGPNYLVECRDSTGKVLTQNGDGKWLKFDNYFINEFEEGPVKDSLEEGNGVKHIRGLSSM